MLCTVNIEPGPLAVMILGVAIIGGVAGQLVAARFQHLLKPPGAIVAKSLAIVDDNINARIVLRLADNGTACVAALDSAGTLRAGMSAPAGRDGSAAVMAAYASGEPGAQLVAGDPLGASVLVMRAAGGVAAALSEHGACAIPPVNGEHGAGGDAR